MIQKKIAPLGAPRVGKTSLVRRFGDIGGAEERFAVPSSYIRGAAGYLIVIDADQKVRLNVVARM